MRLRRSANSGKALKDRLAEAGFPRGALVGDFDGAAYDREASRLVAAARTT